MAYLTGNSFYYTTCSSLLISTSIHAANETSNYISIMITVSIIGIICLVVLGHKLLKCCLGLGKGRNN